MSNSRAEQFITLFESWRDAETFQQEYAIKSDPIAHYYNKILSQHIDMARGKDKKVRGRAKAVLRHFVNWRESEKEHHEKHKKSPTMDDLAAQKPAALKAWRHYKTHVAPKEKRYHKEAWLLHNETELAKKGKK